MWDGQLVLPYRPEGNLSAALLVVNCIYSFLSLMVIHLDIFFKIPRKPPNSFVDMPKTGASCRPCHLKFIIVMSAVGVVGVKIGIYVT